MPNKLVIVESPTKAKTLRKILGKEYVIKASMGHIADLPRKKLGIDLKNRFKPTYEMLSDKQQTVNEIKSAARGSSFIYLAPDPDREGEAIAWHLARAIGHTSSRNIYRVMFHELTQKAVFKAFANPDSINLDKVAAQQARRILDRLVGYKVSPLLWKKVKSGLSAGRVQSVALRLICERDREILAFKPEEFWVINGLFRAQNPPDFQAKLVKYNREKVKIRNTEQAVQLYKEILAQKYSVTKLSSRKQNKQPPAPYITSTLQQEAHKKLKFPAQKTMSVAQKLYEGKDVGDKGPVGLITYMRTDSVRLSTDFTDAARNYISAHFGSEYVPQRPPVYKNRSASQDAHEAVRPTAIERTPDSIRSFLSRDEADLYSLIWARAVASQMLPAQFAQTFAEISGEPCTFLAQGRVQLFDGYLRVFNDDQIERKDRRAPKASQRDRPLPKLEEGESVTLLNTEKKQQFTQPLPRFNEATLIKELEKNGIGRPSTYATIVQKIKEHGYTSIEKDRFVPTQLGFIVIDMLLASFPELFTVTFTADMEKKLDLVESGKIKWLQILEEFYGPFERELKRALASVAKVKLESVESEAHKSAPGTRIESTRQRPDQNGTEQHCPHCQSTLITKKGKYGDFLACPGYPDCTFTRSLTSPERAAPATISARPQRKTDKQEKLCPRCGQSLRLRKGKHGEFLGCSQYPKCTYTEPVGEHLPCYMPGCSGKMVQRTSKKGTRFFGCSRYPECNALLWKEPHPMKCPECGSPVVLKKETKRVWSYTCPRKECNHSWDEQKDERKHT